MGCCCNPIRCLPWKCKRSRAKLRLNDFNRKTMKEKEKNNSTCNSRKTKWRSRRSMASEFLPTCSRTRLWATWLKVLARRRMKRKSNCHRRNRRMGARKKRTRTRKYLRSATHLGRTRARRNWRARLWKGRTRTRMARRILILHSMTMNRRSLRATTCQWRTQEMKRRACLRSWSQWSVRKKRTRRKKICQWRCSQRSARKRKTQRRRVCPSTRSVRKRMWRTRRKRRSLRWTLRMK